MAEEPLPQPPPSLRRDAETGEHDDGLSAFAPVRPRLFGIAYRMLGSAAEAEDIVQDVWLPWQSTNRSVVENPAAFLATTTTRLCINLAQSAQSRRETYIGTWLPEPVDTSSDPGLSWSRQMDRQPFSCRAMASPLRSRRLRPRRKASIRSCGSCDQASSLQFQSQANDWATCQGRQPPSTPPDRNSGRSEKLTVVRQFDHLRCGQQRDRA
jgi:DNA-directed RNA polymerase specialized sigma24 family protein